MISCAAPIAGSSFCGSTKPRIERRTEKHERKDQQNRRKIGDKSSKSFLASVEHNNHSPENQGTEHRNRTRPGQSVDKGQKDDRHEYPDEEEMDRPACLGTQ